MTRDDDENDVADDRQNRGVIRDVLQHAHRHVSDAISADKNNYADAAVRSYALAMDYFKTYLKMAEIEKHYGTIWFRLRRRRVPFFIHGFLTKDVYAFSSSSLFDFASCARVNGWFWLCSTRVFLFAAAPRAYYYVREEEEEEDLVLLLLLLLLRRYARRAPTTGRENRAVSEAVAEIEERFDARKIQRKEGRGREEGDEC